MTTITDAAIKCLDGIFCNPGSKHRHKDLLIQYCVTPGFSFPYSEGFMTSEGGFVGRSIAATIALAAGQITEPKLQLTTEDLW